MRKKQRNHSFVMLSRQMLHTNEWRQLSDSAQLIYIHVKSKFVGNNNGQIRLYYSELLDIKSPTTISRAFKELEDREWIERIKVGFGKYRWVYDIRLTGKFDPCIN